MEAFGNPLPSGLVLRVAQPGDEALERRLYASTRAEEMAVTGWPEAAQEAFVAQQFEAQTRHYRRHFADAGWWIVEQGGQSVGRLILHRTPSRFCVVDITLATECRGQGIGTALLGWVIGEARGAGVPVQLSAFVGSRVVGFYQRLGFRETGHDGLRVYLEWSPVERL